MREKEREREERERGGEREGERGGEREKERERKRGERERARERERERERASCLFLLEGFGLPKQKEPLLPFALWYRLQRIILREEKGFSAF